MVRVDFFAADAMPLLAQNDFGFAHVALGLHQRLLALHHAGSGALAELLH